MLPEPLLVPEQVVEPVAKTWGDATDVQQEQLVAVRWRGETFCNGMLPFGLRSGPQIFTAVADALEWCVREQEVSHIYHYLDDSSLLAPQTQNNTRKIY